MRLTVAILVLLCSLPGKGQNMISNPGFEKRTSEPRTFSQFRRVIDWAVPNFSTPDYFCCKKVYYSGAENIKLGNLPPYEGEAFAGLVIYSRADEEYHEYIYTQLSDTLHGGKKYEVKFYCWLEAENGYHADGFGFALSNRFEFEGDTSDYEIHTKDYPKGQWVEIKSIYEAKGGESHLFIGTFKRPDQMDIVRIDRKLKFKQTYIYVDAVSVTVVP